MDLTYTNHLLEQISQQLKNETTPSGLTLYAVCVSTIVALIEISRWLKSKKRLKITASSHAIDISKDMKTSKSGWIVTVANKSTIPITIAHVNYINKLGIMTITMIGHDKKHVTLEPEHSTSYFIEDGRFNVKDIDTIVVTDSAGDEFKAKMDDWGHGPIWRWVVLEWRSYKHKRLLVKMRKKNK